MSKEENLKLVDKIRKLLAMADPTRGASQQEMETAMRKATELMTEHGIQMMDIGEDKEPSAVNQETFSTRRKRRDEDRWIPVAIKKVFEVEVLYTQVPEVTENGCVARHAYIFIGEPLDIEMAKIGYKMIYDAMRLGLNRHLKSTGKRWNTHTANSFFRGVAKGFMDGSTHGRQAAMKRFKKEEQDRFAIVLAEKMERNALYVKEKIQDVTYRKSRSRAGNDDSAFMSGMNQGAGIDFTTKIK